MRSRSQVTAVGCLCRASLLVARAVHAQMMVSLARGWRHIMSRQSWHSSGGNLEKSLSAALRQ